jgi:hypothetical protein
MMGAASVIALLSPKSAKGEHVVMCDDGVTGIDHATSGPFPSKSEIAILTSREREGFVKSAKRHEALL